MFRKLTIFTQAIFIANFFMMPAHGMIRPANRFLMQKVINRFTLQPKLTKPQIVSPIQKLLNNQRLTNNIYSNWCKWKPITPIKIATKEKVFQIMLRKKTQNELPKLFKLCASYPNTPFMKSGRLYMGSAIA